MPNGDTRHKPSSAAADRHDGLLPINDQIEPIGPVVGGYRYAGHDKADVVVHDGARQLRPQCRIVFLAKEAISQALLAIIMAAGRIGAGWSPGGAAHRSGDLSMRRNCPGNRQHCSCAYDDPRPHTENL